MADLTQQTRDFFAEYSRRSNAALQDPPELDADAFADSFAKYIVGAGPTGVMGGENGKHFAETMAKGFEQYRKIGGTRMEAVDVDVQELDENTVMATVDWEFDYTRPKDGKSGTIAFTNRYFLNFADGKPRVFAYVTPDEEAAMKEHSLI